MNKPILLIDLDGVIISPRHKYFSQRLSEEYNIPIDDIMQFFEFVLERLETSKETVIYVDDDPRNIEVARDFGIHGEVFNSINDLRTIYAN